jgi:hypothetical protein
MKSPKRQNRYSLREGMVFEKQYYGSSVKLFVVRHNDELQFKVVDKIFPTLTAAARHVIGDETRQISGPVFWGIKN